MTVNLTNTAGASSVSLSPTSNVTLSAYDDEARPLRKEPGGTSAGMTNWSVSKAYEQFQLPAYVPGTEVLSADFHSLYGGDQGSSGNLYVFSVSNDWNESSVSWQTAPQEQSMLATLDFTPGQSFHADLTAYVNQAYQNGGVVSFIIMDNPAAPTLQSFRTLSEDKRLDLTISAA